MRTLSSNLLDALASVTAIIPTYTKITRRDGKVLRMVDLDVDSSVAGEVYISSGGQERSAIELVTGLNSDNVDLKGIYDSQIIDETELLAGAFNFADVEIFLAVHNNPSTEKIVLLKGYFGQFSYDMGKFTLEVNVYNYGFANNIGAVTSPTSRSLLGSPREPLALSAYQMTTTVTGILGPGSLQVGAVVPTAYEGGIGLFTSGSAGGIEIEVRSAGSNVLGLYLPMAVLPQIGDTILLTQGYDGTKYECQTKFNNLINFNGEPDLPGQDEFMNPTIRRM